MKNLRGIIAALTIIGAGFLGLFAVQASADTGDVTAENCVNGTKYTDFDGSYSGRDTMTVWTAGNKPLCKDVAVNFSSFTINNTYNGGGFKNNPTALPQTLFYNKTVMLKKGTDGKTTVAVSVPDACKDYQIDAYVGPVQTKITTSEGLVNTTAIVAALFQRLQTDCGVPMVKVCNPATGQIITVKKSEASKYKPIDDPACKDITVCRLSDKMIVTIKAAQFDSSKYSKNLADCKPAKPHMVYVCNPATGEIILVDEKDAGKYKPANDITCQNVQVCDPATGQIITVKKAKEGNYKPINDPACAQVPVTPPTPQTPQNPQVMSEQTTTTEAAPEALPSTGPTETLSALFGTGSLAGAGTAYIRSRRALYK